MKTDKGNLAEANYRFHWRDGTKNDGVGRDAADALNRLGFGRGAIYALDYYECVGFAESDLVSPPEAATAQMSNKP